MSRVIHREMLLNICIRSHVYTCIHSCIRTHVRSCIRINVRSCIRTHVRSCIRTHIRSCIRTRVRSYIRTRNLDSAGAENQIIVSVTMSTMLSVIVSASYCTSTVSMGVLWLEFPGNRAKFSPMKFLISLSVPSANLVPVHSKARFSIYAVLITMP
jgi:hypothetical protein